ncbi:MAG: hypothetical protein RTU30_15840 [Candidatus Thorarchaeota archaeon]
MRRKQIFTLMILTAFFASFVVAPVAPVRAAGTGTIVIDYSHGQYSSYVEDLDALFEGNLTDLGYTVVWALGGINSSVLSDADGLILGSIYGDDGYTAAEFTAIDNWYKLGGKFLWVAYDSDYGGAQPSLDNNTYILESIGSHVYAEPSQVNDPISNCGGQAYRCVATGTSADITGVNAVLMHGPNLLYGATNAAEDDVAVALETDPIEGVTVLLSYNVSSVISDTDLIAPFAHDDGDSGAFPAVTWENVTQGVVIVSGASPYGDYMPMTADEYYGVPLQGMSFVTQVIDKGMNIAPTLVVGTDMTMILLIGGIGVVVIVIIVAIVFMRKK